MKTGARPALQRTEAKTNLQGLSSLQQAKTNTAKDVQASSPAPAPVALAPVKQAPAQVAPSTDGFLKITHTEWKPDGRSNQPTASRGGSAPPAQKTGGPALSSSISSAYGFGVPQKAPAPAPKAPAPAPQPLQLKEMDAKYQTLERDVPAEFKRTATVLDGKLQGEQVDLRSRAWLHGKDLSQLDSKGMSTAPYLTEQQASRFDVGTQKTTVPSDQVVGGKRVEVQQPNAKLVDKDGQTLQGNNIFVMNDKGDLRATEQAVVRSTDAQKVAMHHSSLNGGKAVSGAGEIHTDSQGIVKTVTDRSGHYRPGEAQTRQTLDALEQKGVKLENVHVELHRGDRTGIGDTVVKGMANEFRQGGETNFLNKHSVLEDLKTTTAKRKEQLDTLAEKRASTGKSGPALNQPAPAQDAQSNFYFGDGSQQAQANGTSGYGPMPPLQQAPANGTGGYGPMPPLQQAPPSEQPGSLYMTPDPPTRFNYV